MLDVSYEKLTRLLLRRIFLMFPMLVGLTIGIIGNSAILSVKTFLLVELGMAVLSPLQCSNHIRSKDTILPF